MEQASSCFAPIPWACFAAPIMRVFFLFLHKIMVKTSDSSNKNKTTPSPHPHPSTEDSNSSASSLNRKRNGTRSNKKSKQPEVDRALVEFLFSPFRKLGLAFYADHTSNRSLLGQPNSKQRKSIENRLAYIKKLQQTDWEEFLELCETLGINGIQPPDFSEDSKESDSPSPAPIKLNKQSKKPSTIQRLRKPSPSPLSPTAMARNIHETFVQELEFNLDFDLPKCNPKGIFVLHAKDVKVLVGAVEELKDKVTIFKPLFDPR